MCRIIPNPAEPDRPGYIVEADRAAGAVMLQADGVTHWFAPEVARRIAQALLQAASWVDPRPVDPYEEDDPEYP